MNEPENLDSTLPVFPTLATCTDGINILSDELVDPLLKDNLAQHFADKSIRSVGDLAQLTEREVNRLPIRNSPSKIDRVKTALSRYAARKFSTSTEANSIVVSSSTPLRQTKRKSLFENMMKPNISAVLECPKPVKRKSTDNSVQTSPIKKKKNNEALYEDLIENFDEEYLFNKFLQRFDYKKILKGYKVSFIILIKKNLINYNYFT